MFSFSKEKNANNFHALCVLLISGIVLIGLPSFGWTQPEIALPPLGTMVTVSEPMQPTMLEGIKVYPDQPLRFDFIVRPSPADSSEEDIQNETQKLIEYFLASLAVPEEKMWVNLSPEEQDRIIPEAFGQTALGRDLLAQDYILKQLTASIIHPDTELGKKFWSLARPKMTDAGGSAQINLDTFHKIWIIPESADIYVKNNTVFITKSHLKVLIEDDYKALQHSSLKQGQSAENNSLSDIQTEIMRTIVVPEIEHEVNEGQNFAPLRQMYHAMVLSAWYKRHVKESLLGKVFVDQEKTTGIEVEDPSANQKIYTQYVQSLQKGVYNFIREEYDQKTQEIIPKRYFSGGFQYVDAEKEADPDAAMIVGRLDPQQLSSEELLNIETKVVLLPLAYHVPDRAGKDTQYSVELAHNAEQYLQALEILKAAYHDYKEPFDEFTWDEHTRIFVATHDGSNMVQATIAVIFNNPALGGLRTLRQAKGHLHIEGPVLAEITAFASDAQMKNMLAVLDMQLMAFAYLESYVQSHMTEPSQVVITINPAKKRQWDFYKNVGFEEVVDENGKPVLWDYSTGDLLDNPEDSEQPALTMVMDLRKTNLMTRITDAQERRFDPNGNPYTSTMRHILSPSRYQYIKDSAMADIAIEVPTDEIRHQAVKDLEGTTDQAETMQIVFSTDLETVEQTNPGGIDFDSAHLSMAETGDTINFTLPSEYKDLSPSDVAGVEANIIRTTAFQSF